MSDETADSGQTPEPKFRRRKEARPDEILDAALSLFVEKSFAGTRVEDIARRAGVSKGAVYLYFPSKDAIAAALVDRAVGGMADEVIAAIRAHTGDPRPLIRRLAGLIAAGIGDEKILAVPKFIIHEANSQPQLAKIYADRVLSRLLPELSALFGRAMDEGHIRRLDPEMLTRSLIGPIFVHMLLAEVFGITPEQGLDLNGLFETHLSVFFAGLDPEKGVS
ncbi:TetR/AcrR family transcriptional regulator [Celeribacter litoreus]|uniref:TetR/AcrR family transcriptional regulator n=1 Tax=Celeribacter litoreus TaxID=2876714 RepID=UPI001CCAAA3B|nr:TetR/AcrR family transcriptional regulator [Celeribacter litoreus]MCA0043276.1 TetR/AcrR family transcriptional regulator [Celeribacter litoreus]